MIIAVKKLKAPRGYDMELRQRTLEKEISCTGIGLHTGEKVNISIKPAPVNFGIRFIRKDIQGNPVIMVKPGNISETDRGTNIFNNGYKVQTIEHLMAAFYGLGIDNAIVELDAPEVPAMDGSAVPFVFMIQEYAGIRIQSAFKKFIIIRKPIKIREDDRLIYIYPSKELKIEYYIDFEHPLLRDQSYKFRFSTMAFIKEISRARTFGFLSEVEELKKRGFAKGGSLDNAIVLDRFRVINPEGLRFKDEFVRHKILDFIGDLATIGKPVIGRFVIKKSGHSLNHIMLKKLVRSRSHWKLLSPEAETGLEEIKLPIFGVNEPVPA